MTGAAASGGSEPVERLGASFRDPSGYVIRYRGEAWRVVQPEFREHYDLLMQSGLYGRLVELGLLIAHEEVAPPAGLGQPYKVLRPRQVGFISYPYEWCFSQLKDAALATLQIQTEALARGLTLKDATAFNLQFVDGRPVWIDTLSFERLDPQEPWVAYQQFCRHFLAPLALMSRRDVRLGQLLRIHLDGIPLDLASRLLPRSTWCQLWLLLHLHLHARSQRKHAGDAPSTKPARRGLSLNSRRGLVHSLEAAVRALHWTPPKSAWGNYYEETVTGGNYLAHKQTLVSEWLGRQKPGSVWDLGANTGRFSRLAAAREIPVYAFDGDPDCVELNYLECRQRGDKHLLPLWMDLTNPSPALGWAGQERSAWLDRGQPDLVMALALLHHLALGNNLPLDRLAHFFHGLSARLLIEFVPKDDPNAQKLLRVRRDIFTGYSRAGFEAAFAGHFRILESCELQNSGRRLYLMERA